AVKERINRALNQTMYLINKKEIDRLTQEFILLGTTGNVYTVVITTRPSCTCPDFLKGFQCKHILFIFLRVLKVKKKNPVIFQKALLTSELRNIFSHASPDRHIIVIKFLNSFTHSSRISLVRGPRGICTKGHAWDLCSLTLGIISNKFVRSCSLKQFLQLVKNVSIVEAISYSVVKIALLSKIILTQHRVTT
ncbi:4635_t:CDS:2, partial [Acaulospora morrowiae]